jgi:metal-dependent amidase/aminoacylase/carboxypeptidase family protein
MLRTELDALPVLEKTGLPYASHVVVRSDQNVEVPVMHACGHDVHMSAWLGTARLLAANKARWSGTLILIGQPAEETIGGAQGMLKDGTLHALSQADVRGGDPCDEAKLQLTVRSYKTEVRKRLLAGIERIAKAEAEAANADKMPLVERVESADAVYNDPELAKKVMTAVTARLGQSNVKQTPPITGSEDFSEYGRDGVPLFMMWVGAIEPGKWNSAKQSGERLPSLHSSVFAPDREPTLKTAILAESTMVLSLLGPGK